MASQVATDVQNSIEDFSVDQLQRILGFEVEENESEERLKRRRFVEFTRIVREETTANAHRGIPTTEFNFAESHPELNDEDTEALVESLWKYGEALGFKVTSKAHKGYIEFTVPEKD